MWIVRRETCELERSLKVSFKAGNGGEGRSRIGRIVDEYILAREVDGQCNCGRLSSMKVVLKYPPRCFCSGKVPRLHKVPNLILKKQFHVHKIDAQNVLYHSPLLCHLLQNIVVSFEKVSEDRHISLILSHPRISMYLKR